jgi:hypothetical protein
MVARRARLDDDERAACARPKLIDDDGDVGFGDLGERVADDDEVEGKPPVCGLVNRPLASTAAATLLSASDRSRGSGRARCGQ